MSIPSIVLAIAAIAGIVWAVVKHDSIGAALFLIALIMVV